MHELSIAKSLVSIASKEAERIGKEVDSVCVKVGVLSGVVPETLVYAYDFVAENTLLHGSKLIVEEVPAKIYCERCRVSTILEEIQKFACQSCGEVSGDLKSGRELEISHFEVKS